MFPDYFDMAALESWMLAIRDEDDELVWARTGEGALPKSIRWEAVSDSGDTIPGGVYRFQLTWTDAGGGVGKSNEHSLYVRKVLRRITLEVTQDPSQFDNGVDRLVPRASESTSHRNQ